MFWQHFTGKEKENTRFCSRSILLLMLRFFSDRNRNLSDEKCSHRNYVISRAIGSRQEERQHESCLAEEFRP